MKPWHNRNFTIELLFFSSLLLISWFGAWQIHKGIEPFNHRSQIFADKAGYYVYLPAMLYYRFDPDRFPPGLDTLTGDGFTLNPDVQRVFTKYTYGVAFLLSPFFLVTAAVHEVLHLDPSGGFSTGFHLMIGLGAAFYLTLGLFLLRRILLRFARPGLTWLTIILLFAGTNLLYYTVVDSLMSHVYSFFLFVLFLYAFLNFLDRRNPMWWWLTAGSMALALLIRPTNILLLYVLFFWDVRSRSGFIQRIRLLVSPASLIPLLVITLLVFLPQLLYWKWAWGSLFYYSYHDESFSFWTKPHLAEIWFDPKNGLFLYSPLVLFMVSGMVLMIVKKVSNGWLLLTLFLIVSYLYASWETWYLGCGFGHRAFVEYYALFGIPMAVLLERVFLMKKLLIRKLVTAVLIVFTGYSIGFSLSWPGCFLGESWDFNYFQINLARSGVLPWELEVGNDTVFPVILLPDQEYGQKVLRVMTDSPLPRPDLIRMKTWVKAGNDLSSGAYLVCSLENDGKTLIYQAARLDSVGVRRGDWYDVKASFRIPRWINPGSVAKMYWWNKNKEHLTLDTLQVTYYIK